LNKIHGDSDIHPVKWEKYFLALAEYSKIIDNQEWSIFANQKLKTIESERNKFKDVTKKQINNNAQLSSRLKIFIGVFIVIMLAIAFRLYVQRKNNYSRG